MRALALLVSSSLILACGGKARPAGPTASTDQPPPASAPVPCSYGFMALYVVPDDPLHAEAAVEVDRATTLLDAGDPATAARRFMACAEMLRAAPADDARAQPNAEVCYYNASYAFATAGRWASEGRAALEAAAAEDTARAAYIREQLLADPPLDCAP